MKKFRQVFVHIGHDKTGSTAIQSFCDRQRHELVKKGYFFLPGQWHGNFASCMESVEDRKKLFVLPDQRSADVQAIIEQDRRYMASLIAQINQTTTSSMIISYEGLPVLSDVGVQRMKAFLSEYSDDIKVICYLRHPISYALSGRITWIMNGEYDDERLPYQNYKSYLASYKKHFGAEKLILKKFERSLLLNGNVVDDFLSLIGLNHEDFQTDKFLGVNESLSLESMELGKIINRKGREAYGVNYPDEHQRIGMKAILREIHGGKAFLLPGEIARVREVAADQCRYLNDEFGISFDLADLPAPSAGEMPSVPLNPKFAESIADILLRCAGDSGQELQRPTAHNIAEAKKEGEIKRRIRDRWQAINLLDATILKRHRPRCILCGYSGKRSQFTIHTSRCIFEGGTLERYECPSCQCIFGPRKVLELQRAVLAQDYEDLYSFYADSDSTTSELRAFRALQPRPGGVYLNYGSGRSSNSVAKLNEEGYRVHAHDPFNPGNQPNLLSRREIRQMRFDGIYSNNVIEHFIDPVAEFRFLRSLLKRGGLMSHATPCYEYLYENTRFHTIFLTGKSVEVLGSKSRLHLGPRERDGEYICQVFRRSIWPFWR